MELGQITRAISPFLRVYQADYTVSAYMPRALDIKWTSFESDSVIRIVIAYRAVEKQKHNGNISRRPNGYDSTNEIYKNKIGQIDLLGQKCISFKKQFHLRMII